MDKRWGVAARDALVSGSLAAAASTAALAVAGRIETGSAVAPTNAISHWVYGDRAARQDAPSVRHTLVGYGIHHGASVFWAAAFERLFGRQTERGRLGPAIAGGLAVAAVACFVDYKLTPHRLQPGYEMRLSRRSLAAVYAMFGLGLAAGALVNARVKARSARTT
jgi:hypothetical protein